MTRTPAVQPGMVNNNDLSAAAVNATPNSGGGRQPPVTDLTGGATITPTTGSKSHHHNSSRNDPKTFSRQNSANDMLNSEKLVSWIKITEDFYIKANQALIKLLWLNEWVKVKMSYRVLYHSQLLLAYFIFVHTNSRGTLLWPIRRNAVTTQAQEHLESWDFNHRLLAIGPTRNFSNF